MRGIQTMTKLEEKNIKTRILFFRLLIIFLLLLAVLISILGGGDSRKLTNEALSFGSQSILLGIIYSIVQISRNKSYLADKSILKKPDMIKKIEKRTALHNLSGGTVWTISFFICYLVAIITSQFNQEAFYSSLAILCSILIVKIIVYLYHIKKGDYNNELR